MTLRDAVMTVGAMVASASMLLAAVMIWLVLTMPAAVADPAGGPGAVGVVRTAVMTLHTTVMEHLKHSSGEPQ
jgi:hypothetical protein